MYAEFHTPAPLELDQLEIPQNTAPVASSTAVSFANISTEQPKLVYARSHGNGSCTLQSPSASFYSLVVCLLSFIAGVEVNFHFYINPYCIMNINAHLVLQNPLLFEKAMKKPFNPKILSNQMLMLKPNYLSKLSLNFKFRSC